MKAIIESNFCSDTITIMAKTEGRRPAWIRGKVELVEVDDNNLVSKDCCITMHRDLAIELAMALLEAAVKARILPDMNEVNGELKATKKHLEDLQRAFNKLLEAK